MKIAKAIKIPMAAKVTIQKNNPAQHNMATIKTILEPNAIKQQ